MTTTLTCRISPSVEHLRSSLVSGNDINRNKLFQFATSGIDPSKNGEIDLYSRLNELSTSEPSPDLENIGATLTVEVRLDGRSGTTCFQLVRHGAAERSGVVAVLVFDRNRNVIRYS